MGEPYRIKYGSAIGPLGTYAATSALSLFTAGDTSPDVTDGTLFYSNNTSATTITYFDVTGPGGQGGDSFHQGKVITVFFRDANTSIANGGQIFLAQGSGGAIPANTVIDFILHNSAWYERSRSQTNQNYVKTLAVGGTAQSIALGGAQVVILVPTAATTITAITGIPPAGQFFILMKTIAAANAGTALTLQGGSNYFLAGTTAVVMNNSGSYTFLSVDGTTAVSQAGVASP